MNSDIHPINTDAQYRAVLRTVSALFDNEPEPGTLEGVYFEAMITLIEAFESMHVQIEPTNSGRKQPATD